MIEGLIKRFPYKIPLARARNWTPHLQQFNSRSIVNISSVRDKETIAKVQPGLAVRDTKTGNILFRDNEKLVFLFKDRIPLHLEERFMTNSYYREKLALLPEGTEITFDDFLIFIKHGDDYILKPSERYVMPDGVELRFEV